MNFGAHKRIGLQLSGGKDSVACLYLARQYIEQITVYHLNTGDQPPETADVIAECRKIIPNFVEIRTDSRAWISRNGYPSDVVPTFSSPMGRFLGFGKLPLTDRFSCCWANLMEPMHSRMMLDGITLIIRGQKLVDMPNVPFKSGAVEGGIEVLYPIEDWSDERVFAYLRQENAPIHPVYTKLPGGIDCLHCTAWWDERHLDWMREAHPEPAQWVAGKHVEIKRAVAAQLSHLDN